MGLLNPLALLSGNAPAAPEPPADAGASIMAMLQAPPAEQPEAPSSSGATPTGLPPTATAVPVPADGAGAAGIALPPGRAVVDIDSGNPPKKQTKVTPITIYQTEPGYRVGKLIAVSPRYAPAGNPCGACARKPLTRGQPGTFAMACAAGASA
jgi:hypothetical protein